MAVVIIAAIIMVIIVVNIIIVGGGGGQVRDGAFSWYGRAKRVVINAFAFHMGAVALGTFVAISGKHV